MKNGIYIKTFGCQMNEYDSGKMADVLHRSHALETVSRPEQARVLLMNTCSVREKAQEKLGWSAEVSMEEVARRLVESAKSELASHQDSN